MIIGSDFLGNLNFIPYSRKERDWDPSKACSKGYCKVSRRECSKVSRRDERLKHLK